MKKAMTLLVAMAAVASACISTAEAAVGSSEWFFVDTTETHQDYVVTFDPNEGTRKPFLVIEEQKFTAGVPQKLWKNEYVRDGYDFKGWAKDSKTRADAGTVDFLDEQLIPSLDSDMTLYAVWEKRPPVMVTTFSIVFNANGGKGSIPDTVVDAPGQPVTLPLNNGHITKDGYVFIGWSIFPGSAEVKYADGATVPFDGPQTLYAQWMPADSTRSIRFMADLDKNGIENWERGPDPKKVLISITGNGMGATVKRTCNLDETIRLPDGNYTAQISYSEDVKDWVFFWRLKNAEVVFTTGAGTDNAVEEIGFELLRYEPNLRVVFDPGDGGVSSSPITYELEDNTGRGLAAYIEHLPTATPPRNYNGGGWKFEGWWTTKDDVAGSIEIKEKVWLPFGNVSAHFVESQRKGEYSVVRIYETKVFARWKPEKWFLVVEEDEDGAGPASFSSGRTYASYLKSADGGLAGTATVKTAKEKNGVVAATVTIQPVGGKKRTVKGTVSAADGSGQGALAGLRFTAGGVTGTLDGYAVDGAEDAAKSKAADAKAVLDSFKGKAYTLALAVADGSGLTVGFSVVFAAKGRAKVAGTLPDGTKVAAQASLVVGEKTCCLPVAYSKKSSLGFVLWFDRAGNFLQAGNVTAWKGSGFEVRWSDEVAAGLLAGSGLRDGSCLNVAEPPGEIGGAAVVKRLLPVNVEVAKGGTGWMVAKPAAVKMDRNGVLSYGANPAQVKLKYKAKDGTFSGSFVFYSEAGGRLKKSRAVVNGVVVDGVGYGTAVVRKVGAWPVTIGPDRVEAEGDY